jgi:membrane-bound ClpP family serine protease
MPARGVSAVGSRGIPLVVHARKERTPVIILGVILILVGYLLPVPGIIATIGWILLVIGLVLLVLGRTGRPVGGRRYWY